MEKQEALEKLQRQLQEISELRNLSSGKETIIFGKWQRDTKIVIEKIFGINAPHIHEFEQISFTPPTPENYSSPPPVSYFPYYFKKGLDGSCALLHSMIQEVKDFWEELSVNQSSIPNSFKTEDLAIIEHICNKFHSAANQLTIRYSNRQTLKITDEYDVQDLFHSFLRLNFDIITKEEPIPNFASRSSRVDFFLPEQEIFIELKKTRQGLGDKELREQLIVDITQYKQHKGWKTLVCFVYDPEGRIKEPRAIEKDLSQPTDGLDVKVFIRPKIE